MFHPKDLLSRDSLYAFLTVGFDRVKSVEWARDFQRAIYARYDAKIGNVTNYSLWLYVAKTLESTFNARVRPRTTLAAMIQTVKGGEK